MLRNEPPRDTMKTKKKVHRLISLACILYESVFKMIALTVPLHGIEKVAAISRRCRHNGEGRLREGDNG